MLSLEQIPGTSLPLPRALPFVEGWESQCNGGLGGRTPCPAEDAGLPASALLFSWSKGSKDFWALWDPLARSVCGAVGQGYCGVVSEHDFVIDIGRKGKGEGIHFAAKTFRARGWVWTSALSGHTCRFLQFVAAVAVTTSSGTQVNKIWERHPAIETLSGYF